MSDLRIAATRAGHQNGDGHEGNGSMTATEGGRRLADAPPEIARRVRRRAVAKPAAAPKAAPASKPPRGAVPAPVPPARRPPVSPDRSKVLRQRRRRRRLLIAFTAFTAFCTFFVGLGYVYVQRKLDQITRLELPALADDSGPVMNVLLVGSDSRANLAASDAKGFGQDVVTGQRSDTIMLLHVDPGEQRAAIVSVPRDLYVPIANTNRSDRVNAAFALGGPDQLVATVQRTLGITIHHYVQVDFSGFKDIVDTVGGVTMYVPYPVRDSGSGLDLGRAGCWELDGNKGLSWVRSRNMEFLINGTWQADGRGDLGRIERQQDFIRRMMKKALSAGISNPLQLNRLIGVGVRDVTFDTRPVDQGPDRPGPALQLPRPRQGGAPHPAHRPRRHRRQVRPQAPDRPGPAHDRPAQRQGPARQHADHGRRRRPDHHGAGVRRQAGRRQGAHPQRRRHRGPGHQDGHQPDRRRLRRGRQGRRAGAGAEDHHHLRHRAAGQGPARAEHAARAGDR